MKRESTTHISWLLTWASLALLVGTIAARKVGPASANLLLLAICSSILMLVSRSRTAIVFAVVFGLSLGLWRAGLVVRDLEHWQSYIGETKQIEAKISTDPSTDVDGDTELLLEQISSNGRRLAGTFWVSLSTDQQLRRSDMVTIEGKISEGFGTIPAAMYQANLIKIVPYAETGRDTRDSFAASIRRMIREPEASLASGFLLGQKTTLPERLDNELRILGLTHIVVASGYNLTILVRFARRFGMRLSRFSALAGSGFLLAGFVALSGSSPSMTRAGLITSASLLAWYFGRKFHAFVLLTVCAAITVLVKPSYAWGDLGWLLSFASFAGVIMLAPLLHTYFWGDKKPNALRQVCIETLSALVCTLPITMYYFGYFSPLALLANVLILPFIPIAMLLSFVAGTVGFLGSIPVFGIPAELIIRYMTTIIQRLSSQSFAMSEVNITWSTVLCMYLVLTTVFVFLWRRSGYRFREYNTIE